MTSGHDGSLGSTTVTRLVEACRPNWEVAAFTPAAEGTDAVYFLTVETPDGPRDAVLKAREFVDPAAFRVEPVLLDLFADTPVPVPRVLGRVDEERPDLPTPCFLLERCDGQSVEPVDLPADALDRLAREAGRHLAHVHTTGEFDRFGPVRRRADTARDGSAVAVDGRQLAVAAEGSHGRWGERVAAMAEDRLAGIDDRFVDLREPLRRFVDARLDSVDGWFDPALVHHDYRPGNLLADPGTGETRAVLDWGNAFTGERAYNLVATESYLCARRPPGHPRRKHVRAAMRVGYAEVTALPQLPERRRELYLAVTHLAALEWFEEWYADATDAERRRAAERNREYVRELLG